ncbi:unnamed protein product [Effrenium voratum]|uniref:Ubiquitin-like domain-containing protein n=1 Tax=Effrenium voratum TaxID=2562239 RepID=A0AA36MPW3_9DINO|nr:unnamed protein product [Effrenium voratum]
MAPRAAEVVPRQKTGEDSGCEATFFEAEEEASPPLELHELVALKVIQQGRLVLETQVDATTTVGHIKGQLELANGTPGDAQILTLHGLPLQNTQVLREQICQPATITMRKSDASWAAELEELLGAGDVASLFRARQSLGLLRDAAAQDAHALKEQALQLFADMTGKFKKATSMVLSSAAGLEAAASELRRNREVVFEVVPRSSKGSRRAAEDLMRCRSGLLSSANINGEMLMSCSRLLGPSHFELTAQLKELREVLQQQQELLLREQELLQLQRHGHSLSHAAVQRELQESHVALEGLEEDGILLEQLAQELLTARRAYRSAVASNLIAIKRSTEYLQQDEGVVLSWALNHVSKGRILDRDFILTVVQSNGEALEDAPPELQEDREVVLEALRSSNGWALQFAAAGLKRDREIVLTAVRRNGLSLEFAAAEMRADRDVVLAAVQVQGEALEFAAEALRNDHEIVATAIRTSRGWAMQFASQELRKDRRLVLGALHANGLMLEHAPSLQGDAEIVVAAVRSNPAALQFATEKLKGDKAVVLAAVSKDGNTLRYASKAMKASREVVLAAAQQAGEHVLLLADEIFHEDAGLAGMARKYSESDVEQSAGVEENSWTDTVYVKTRL